jgi:hypothetical protein
MDPHDPIGGPLEDNIKIFRAISQGRTLQINSQEIKSHLRAVGFAWFNSYRQNYDDLLFSDSLSVLDLEYKVLIDAAEKRPRKDNILHHLKRIQNTLKRIRVLALSTARSTIAKSDIPPSFAALVSDPFMQNILLSRWTECMSCLSADAPVAAIVMMGGLLESFLLARINKEPNKQPIYQAKSAPKDKSGTVRPLKDWMLRDYIDVAYELQWISKSAHGISDVLRDYRNYIHPYKQVSSRTILTSKDAKVLWEVFKSIARQLL